MPITLRTILCAFTLIYLPSASASSVTRCESSHGQITFTHLDCPEGHSRSHQNVTSPATIGSNKSLPNVENIKKRKRNRSSIKFAGITSEEGDCPAPITGRERREAIIKKQIRSGMTLSDVESALGKPNKINRKNNKTQYSYKDSKGHTQQVSFDSAGCVFTAR